MPGSPALAAAQTQLPDAPSAQAAAKLPADQLDSLVAPIALYPDPLLSQTLVASTYPLEVVQLQQWLAKNKDLKEKALADAVKKQDWDPSIQALAALPDVVKQLADNIKWTTDLGNAFLAQQSDVMDAVQRMRKKAKDDGNLKSSEQVKVETKTVESKPVIMVEQANPQVIYVPSYNPTVVYGAPVYAYPPMPTRHRAITRQAWRSRSASASPWERCGAAAGDTTADGAATTTSPSITTTTSSTTATAEHQRRQPEPDQRRQSRQQQLAAQSATPRRGSLRRPKHRQQVRRHRPWRLHADPSEQRSPEPGAAAARSAGNRGSASAGNMSSESRQQSQRREP